MVVVITVDMVVEIVADVTMVADVRDLIMHQVVVMGHFSWMTMARYITGHKIKIIIILRINQRSLMKRICIMQIR